MSDKMRPISFSPLIKRILAEYENEKSIFGIHVAKFFKAEKESNIKLFGSIIETPVGPAAGPHTQLAQNIISAYLTGGRFFELKTVQCLDELKIDKPCIDASDEAYNVEWSQELKLEESYCEYLKAWFILHLLKEHLHLSINDTNGFIFNMSVGYNLEGIKSPVMDSFINKLKDARLSAEYIKYIEVLHESFTGSQYCDAIEKISPVISNSVTLSTMHGCPPEDIEAIARYLIKEKGLNTYVKLNPTLLGYETVNEILSRLGYAYIDLDRDSFSHDLQMTDAIPMLNRLQQFASENKVSFGIKLSNTLGVNNTAGKLPGGQMYMSGRSLFPLTINLANCLSKEFDGRISISFSGGASFYNIDDILLTGIYPVTIATDLLKPGGYARLFQIADHIKESLPDYNPNGQINLDKLDELASGVYNSKYYIKGEKRPALVKLKKSLPLFDCYISPCSVACPAHQDIPSYIRLSEQGRYAEALKLILESNPLPHITGYICDHKCMSACTRLDYDGAVEIREIKKIAALNGFKEYIKNLDSNEHQYSNNIKAAVIGAGPSGLSAAYYLKKSGFEVTVFEKSGRAGGTVQNIIPEFRLPQDAINKDIELIEKFGIKFVFGFTENFSLDSLHALGYKYIYVGIGASLPNEFRINGGAENVIGAIEFLKLIRSSGLRLGKSVAVIGGGNSAMDSARAALRVEGVERVFIIYRRTKEFMPADIEEYDNAVKEGVIFKELLLPESYDGKTLCCSRMILTEPDGKGRRKVIQSENEFEDFQVDYIISAIGEHTDWNLLRENKILGQDEKSIHVIEETNESVLGNVFIGGDVLRGPSTVIEAVADGRKAAEAIAAKEFGRVVEYSSLKPSLEIQDEELILEKKGKLCFYSEKNILEACLSCDLLCNKCVEVCPNRANVAIRCNQSSGEFKDKYQILHLDSLCNECGNCATFCPYEGAPYKSKITLFADETDFLESTNDGFYFDDQKEDANIIKLKARYGLYSGEIIVSEDGVISSVSIAEDAETFVKFGKVVSSIVRDYRYLSGV